MKISPVCSYSLINKIMMPIILPKILTLITTYRCTASCHNCCFGCSPNYGKMMSIEEIKKYISVCKEVFPSIRIVVFTGGECTLLWGFPFGKIL